jgi:hypothetical protein
MGESAGKRVEQSGWSPLDGLRSLGRAASIAAGQPQFPWTGQDEYRGFRIVTAGRGDCYCADVTHHDGTALRLPDRFKHHINDANFRSPEEAVQHARFVIASGALNRLLGR